MQHFQYIMFYNFKKSKKKQLEHKHTKICAAHGEGAVTDRMCQRRYVKFRAGNSHWTMLHCWVDKLKMIVINSRHELKTINIVPHRK